MRPANAAGYGSIRCASRTSKKITARREKSHEKDDRKEDRKDHREKED